MSVADLSMAALAAGAVVVMIAMALAIATTRALFAVLMCAAAFGAASAMAAAALGRDAAAMALAAIGAGLLPVFLIGVVLLSARGVRAQRRRVVLAPIAGVLVAAVLTWGARGVFAAPLPPEDSATAGVGFWLVALALVGGFSAFALLAFGERGAFEHRP